MKFHKIFTCLQRVLPLSPNIPTFILVSDQKMLSVHEYSHLSKSAASDNLTVDSNAGRSRSSNIISILEKGLDYIIKYLLHLPIKREFNNLFIVLS